MATTLSAEEDWKNLLQFGMQEPYLTSLHKAINAPFRVSQNPLKKLLMNSMQVLLFVKALTLFTTWADPTENTLTCRQPDILKRYSYALLPPPKQYAHLLQLMTHFMTVSRRLLAQEKLKTKLFSLLLPRTTKHFKSVNRCAIMAVMKLLFSDNLCLPANKRLHTVIQ